MLAAAIVTSALTGPGQTLGVSVFIDHFVEDLGLSRSQVSTAYLIGTLSGAALLPRVGRFVDNRGVRLSQAIIGVLFGLALINMSMVNGLVWLSIGFIGIRFFGQGSLSLIATVTVSLRYTANRGSALGIYSTMAGGLMALLPLAITAIINTVGWRSTWLILAAVIWAVVVPVAWFGLRSMPRGSQPETSLEDPEIDVDDGTDHYSRNEAIRTSSFWMLGAVMASASMLGTGLNFHQIDLLGQAGMSETEAAALFIPQIIGTTIAGLAVGFFSDRMGTRFLPALGAALLAIAHWLAAIVEPGVIVIVYAIVLGAMAGGIRTTMSIILPAWFGTAHLGAIQGTMTFIIVGASALGPVVLALTEAAYGSYTSAVLSLSLLPVAVSLLALSPASRAPTTRAAPPSSDAIR